MKNKKNMDTLIELSKEELLSIDGGEYVDMRREGYAAGRYVGKIIGGALMLFGVYALL